MSHQFQANTLLSTRENLQNVAELGSVHWKFTLSPNVSMHFLLTVLHIFLMVLVGRICAKIKTSYL